MIPSMPTAMKFLTIIFGRIELAGEKFVFPPLQVQVSSTASSSFLHCKFKFSSYQVYLKFTSGLPQLYLLFDIAKG